MKICIVGPGFMPIPSSGWGAVENLIWDIRNCLVTRGHEVLIVNTTNQNQIINEVNAWDPDFVHVQYDDYAGVIPHLKTKNVALTSHYGYLTQPHRWDGGYRNIFNNQLNSGANIFCLSPQILKIYESAGYPKEKLFVTPNGADVKSFRFEENFNENTTACLAKVENRKRQNLTHHVESVKYYGRPAPGFEHVIQNNKNYMGEITRADLFQKLTNHANLTLLSDGEAHALVINEAASAGLGIVLSEFAWSNINPQLPWVTIIPELLMIDKGYIEHAITKNAHTALGMRKQIREYAENYLSWDFMIDRYYITYMNSIIERNKF